MAVQTTVHIKQPPSIVLQGNPNNTDKSFTSNLHYVSGFDANDKLLSDLTFTDATAKRKQMHIEDVAKVRIHEGRATMFDSTGSPLPVPFSPGATQSNLVSGLQSNALATPTSGIVVSDIVAYASSRRGQLAYPSSTSAVITSSYAGQITIMTHRYFSKVGAVWILTQFQIVADSATHTLTRTVTFQNVKYFENTTGDARRRAVALKQPRQPAIQQASPSSFNFRNSTYLPQLQTSAQANSTAPGPGTSQSTGAKGSNVAFLHGFLSSGATWSRMSPWLTADNNFASTIAPNDGNGGKEALVTWAQEANNDLSNAGTGYLAIGHSAGGLIGRSVALANPSLVRGVITIDTPHQGSIALSNGFYYAQELATYGVGYAASDACSLLDLGSCVALTGTLGYVSIAGLDTLVAFTAGAALDLKYHSPYTQALNATPTIVPHGFVATESDPRWLEYRLGADLFSYPDDLLGGRNVALLAEGTYDTLDFLSFLYEEYAEDAYDNGDDDDGDFYSELSYLASDGDYWMDWIDGNFYNFVNIDNASGDQDVGGDGIVQISSQYYPDPSAPGELITGGDSHVAATKSSYVRTAVDQLLTLQMFAPPVSTPVACTYALTNETGGNIPYSGGLVQVKVITPQTCKWAFSSNSSFLIPNTFYPGPDNQQGNAIAEFTVEPNLSAYPLQGTVIVAGQAFSITQNPKPDTVGAGIIYMAPCTPQDNCAKGTGSGASPSATIAGIGQTANCYAAVALCLGNLMDAINYNKASVVTGYLDLIGSRLFLFSNSPANAYAPFSATIVNNSSMPIKISTSGTNLAP